MILKNKKFVISAAGDGIGFSITKFIVQNGGKVYLTDIDQQKIDKIKRNKKFNNKIFASKLDANNYNHVRKYFLSLSIPKYFLPNFFATTAVVPVPKKGSNIASPLLVVAKIILCKRASGF